jgi:5-(carboxyamino)imidazole ribonucleotide mutase
LRNDACGAKPRSGSCQGPAGQVFARFFTNTAVERHEDSDMTASIPDAPKVGIIMGSQSDWPTMRLAAEALERLKVPFEAKIVSAHRTPERLFSYAKSAKARGLKVIIAGAGGAAHLPGMVASLTTLPVLGVPIESRALKGQDSLYSIVQMPAGIPVGTLAIGAAGAENAGLLAAQILALEDRELAARVEEHRARQTAAVAEAPEDE